MGKIIISENASLDGVVQDPTGDDGTPFGGWFNQITDVDRQAWAGAGLEEAMVAKAFLLGRKSDHWFGSRWMSRSGASADRLNTMPKFVFSSTLETATWGNSTILRGDLADEVATLKREIDGDLVLVGSTTLAQAFWANDLVDELRLKLFPVVAGSGSRGICHNSDPGETWKNWPDFKAHLPRRFQSLLERRDDGAGDHKPVLRVSAP